MPPRFCFSTSRRSSNTFNCSESAADCQSATGWRGPVESCRASFFISPSSGSDSIIRTISLALEPEIHSFAIRALSRVNDPQRHKSSFQTLFCNGNGTVLRTGCHGWSVFSLTSTFAWRSKRQLTNRLSAEHLQRKTVTSTSHDLERLRIGILRDERTLQ